MHGTVVSFAPATRCPMEEERAAVRFQAAASAAMMRAAQGPREVPAQTTDNVKMP